MLLKEKYNITRKDFQTIIGPNTIFNGNIQSAGSICIQGEINGDIATEDDLFIDSFGHFKGNITAKNVHISGKVDGNMISRNTIRMLSTAKVYGDLFTKGLIIEEGAVYEGKCDMKENHNFPILENGIYSRLASDL